MSRNSLEDHGNASKDPKSEIALCIFLINMVIIKNSGTILIKEESTGKVYLEEEPVILFPRQKGPWRLKISLSTRSLGYLSHICVTTDT